MPNININDLNYNIFRIPITIKKLYIIMSISLSVKIKMLERQLLNFTLLDKKSPNSSGDKKLITMKTQLNMSTILY